MKYLQGSFGSRAATDEYRTSWDANFAGGSAPGSSIRQCPKCKVYGRADRPCPNGCDAEVAKPWTQLELL